MGFLTDLYNNKKQKEARSVIYDGEYITAQEFLARWLDSFKDNDRPGCYVILIFDSKVKDDNFKKYKNAYVGQSVNVFHRVHQHLTGHGNGDVYADLRNGKYLYVQVRICSEESLNDMERTLIGMFDYNKMYNKTRGGGTERCFDDSDVYGSNRTTTGFPLHSSEVDIESNDVSAPRLCRIPFIRVKAYKGHAVALRLSVDGVEVARVNNGETAFFDTTEGVHEIELRAPLQRKIYTIELHKNDQIVFNSDEKPSFRVSPRPHQKNRR